MPGEEFGGALCKGPCKLYCGRWDFCHGGKSDAEKSLELSESKKKMAGFKRHQIKLCLGAIQPNANQWVFHHKLPKKGVVSYTPLVF